MLENRADLVTIWGETARGSNFAEYPLLSPVPAHNGNGLANASSRQFHCLHPFSVHLLRSRYTLIHVFRRELVKESGVEEVSEMKCKLQRRKSSFSPRAKISDSS